MCSLRMRMKCVAGDVSSDTTLMAACRAFIMSRKQITLDEGHGETICFRGPGHTAFDSSPD